MRRQINQDVDNYRVSYQRPETRREYDLYDPSGLKKELPCRVADDDPRCGPSSAQKFAGEDLKGKERLATQRDQQRAWLRQQLAERQTAEEERQRAERALQEAVISQDRHASCKQQVQEECRRKVQQATLDFNKALAAEQEARRRAEEAMEEEDKRMEVFNLMTGDFLTENPAVAVSSLGSHRLIPDRWKGMSSQQTEEIRLEQLRQAQQKQMEKEAEAKRQQDWEDYILNCDEQALKAEHDLFEKRRQLNEHMAQYNKLLAEQQNVHRDYIERVVYSNEASKEYFDQFNTTTR
ncbi:hypothetical protein B566_EDAN003124 [Ephemera danica]|nr:hypothetical protein B566_EDAN003124 [Ephemera danica]